MNFAADFNYTCDLLRKFNESPGTMSLEEVKDVREFLLGYMKIRDMFHNACGFYPFGLTLESYVGKADWYLEFHKNKKGGQRCGKVL